MSVVDTARKFIETFFEKDSTWDRLSQYVDGDGTLEHQLLQPSTIRAAHASLSGPFRDAFPDLTQRVVSTAVADDGKVFVKTFASGTFTGAWGQFQPNGRRWEIPVVWELTIKGDKVVHANEIENHHAINQQLGLPLFKSQIEQEIATREKAAITDVIESLKAVLTGGVSRPLAAPVTDQDDPIRNWRGTLFSGSAAAAVAAPAPAAASDETQAATAVLR